MTWICAKCGSNLVGPCQCCEMPWCPMCFKHVEMVKTRRDYCEVCEDDTSQIAVGDHYECVRCGSKTHFNIKKKTYDKVQRRL